MGARIRFIAVIAALSLIVSGCAGQAVGRPEISPGSLEQSQLELQVLETVTGPAEAAYVPADRTVYLTIYVEDMSEVTTADVESIRDAAEQVTGDRGIRVVVELDDGEPPGSE